jgi:hypothetical protein
MRLADFFTGHLKKKQRVAFRRKRLGMHLISTPCIKIGGRLTSEGFRPLFFERL